MEKYQHINLEDYIQSGEGGTALSYNHKDGKTLAKLFMKGMGAENAEREFLVNKIVYNMGIPTPKMLFVISKIRNGSGAPSDMMLSMLRRNLGI